MKLQNMDKKLLCYCFEISEQEALDEIQKSGKSRVYERVLELIKQNGCDCEVKNPKKSCCLPDIKEWLKAQRLESNQSGSHCSCC